MKRRRFLQLGCSATAGALLQPMARPVGVRWGAAAKQPNVVFLLADQWRAQATGYSGDANAKTPNLDRLASQSVNFIHAVSCCPVCTPYRGSLLTGRYPLTTGLFLNDVCLNTEAVSLAQAFDRAGYHTGYIGKWHLDGHGRSSFVPPDRRQGFQFWRAAECTHNYNKSHYYGDSPEKRFWDGYDAVAQTEEACGYIRGHTNHPFMLILSWGPPHNPYETAPQEYRQIFKAEEIILRANVPPPLQEAARRDLAGYYAHIAALDYCIGLIADTLAKLGIERSTILVFTSDHGDMLGSQSENRKQRPWDESIRVPFLLRYPALLGRAGRKLRLPINTPDIMPTLLGLCGIPIPTTVEGVDRTKLLQGGEPDHDEAALITCVAPFGEWTRARGGREYRGVRTSRYTYVRTLEGPWLLYDNERDPYQLENLVNRPDHASLQYNLEARLKRRLEETHDEFRPAAEYIKKWGHKVDSTGTVPYRL